MKDVYRIVFLFYFLIVYNKEILEIFLIFCISRMGKLIIDYLYVFVIIIIMF